MLKTAAIALIALVAVAAAQGPPLRGGAGWVFPPGGGGSAISDTTCAGACTQAISDSITAFGRDTAQAAAFTGVYADSVNTPILRLYGAQFFLSDSPDFVTYSGNMIFNGGIGFFGKFPTVFVPCELPYATPPNPVTAAQERAAYDLALQNCLDESGVNLVNTP